MLRCCRYCFLASCHGFASKRILGDGGLLHGGVAGFGGLKGKVSSFEGEGLFSTVLNLSIISLFQVHSPSLLHQTRSFFHHRTRNHTTSWARNSSVACKGATKRRNGIYHTHTVLERCYVLYNIFLCVDCSFGTHCYCDRLSAALDDRRWGGSLSGVRPRRPFTRARLNGLSRWVRTRGRGSLKGYLRDLSSLEASLFQSA